MTVDTRAQPVVAAKLRAPRMAALVRERLDVLLARLWSHRLGLVIAPPGSGKTTLLAHFAAAADAPVAWYRPESWDGAADVFLSHLEAALARALGDLAPGWTAAEQAARALEGWSGERVLLVIDDLHALEGTPAEAELARLLDCAPASLVVLAAARRQPRFNMARLRVSGGLLEIGGDDLRFRSWEVERLFREFYREPLPPVELAQLARRTEGWVAGLQLFHLATRGKAPEERRRVLAGLGGASRFVREYLADNVLSDLPAELRRFLVETCVLGRLSGRICDCFLGQGDGERALRELERRQVFTQPLDDDGHYRYHEVLRSHLEVVLLQEEGEQSVRERYRRAGAVLEAAGAPTEALHAYCRAEDWAALDRLLGSGGEQLVQGWASWVHLIPSAMLEDDPWLLLASARRFRADGLLPAALDAYQRAEQAFGAAEAARLARDERLALAAWASPGPTAGTGLLAGLRAVARSDPGAHRARSDPEGAPGPLLSGLGALLAGYPRAARRELESAVSAPGTTGVQTVAARLGLAVAGVLAGDAGAWHEAAWAVETAERLEIPFLGRLGQSCQAMAAGRAGDAAAARLACERAGDEWGWALAGLLEGWLRAAGTGRGELGEAAALLADVAAWFERAEAPVLGAWARAWWAVALAGLGRPEAATAAATAERQAAARGVDGARLVACLALAAAEPRRRAQHAALAADLGTDTGLELAIPALAPAPSVSVRLFGGFELAVDGVPHELALKPRVRALLRLLAVQAGRPLHRDTIQEALWPDVEPRAGARNLHVAISSLRQALDPLGAPGRPLLVRDGDAYRLCVGAHAECDLVAFEADLAAGRAARAREAERAVACFRRALDRCVGELLPEDGAAEWVVGPRERCRAAAADAAQALAELLLERGDPAGAAAACSAGLRIDRYHDPLWRLLASARERGGDWMAASRARAAYRQALAELGLES